MAQEGRFSYLVIVVPLIVVIIFILGAVFLSSTILHQQPQQMACTQEAKICPDGSSVGRTGPNCEFAQCPTANQTMYTNNLYGFSLTFPTTWNGYSVVEGTWTGHMIDDSNQMVTGPLITIKNPQTTSQQVWQDIPVMVFTPSQWSLITSEKLAVSAAPIGPSQIGQNAKYIFATPPRWYGFTDAVGWQEAVDIVKTFKTF